MMKNERQRITALIIKRIAGRTNDLEDNELEGWALLSPGNRQILDDFLDENRLMRELMQYHQLDGSAAWKALTLQVPELRPVSTPRPYMSQYPVREWLSQAGLTLQRHKWAIGKWAIGLLLAVAGISIIVPLILHRRPPSQPAEAKAKQAEPMPDQTVAGNDLLPGGLKLMVMLPSGQSLDVKSLPLRKTLQYDNVTMRKVNEGTLEYTSLEKGGTRLSDNKVITPKGGWYNVLLPDGSRVLLNAASSLRFASSFGREDRNVILDGEAYFEVAHSNDGPKKQKPPFIVQVKTTRDDVVKISARGTSFNVAAYGEDAVIKTTLLKGHVSVEDPNRSISRELLAGQQFSLYADGKNSLINVDTAAAIAWTNNEVIFNGEPLQEVMRQIGRWYNATVSYQGNPTMSVRTRWDRSATAFRILHQLAGSQDAKFLIKGNEIIVSR